MRVAVANPYRYRQTLGMFVEFGRGMNNPYDVAPAGDGHLFVLNRSNIFDAPVGGLRIGIITLDEDYLGEWGAYGTGPGQLVWPNSMVLDAHGRLLISDEWRHDVQCFDQDGTLIHRWGGPGTADGHFNRPAGLSIDHAGHIIVADWGNERVQILRPDGAHLATLHGDATLSKWAREFIEASPDVAAKRQSAADLEAEKRFWGAVSVRVDGTGRLYVAEHSRHRLQIYKRVEVCFTNPGTSEMHFVAALDKVEGMRCVLALFEGVVTGAADGYWRMLDRPAATLLHLGPGLGNGPANLHNAKKASGGMVNFVGDHATYQIRYNPPLTADIQGIAR